MKDKRQLILTIILFGSIWGIIEATVGYVLHIIPGLSLYMSGAVLFSFASYILYRAYKLTNSKAALLYIGMVAAAIKSVNFFLPLASPFKVINPMLSIIMESLVLIAVMTMVTKDNPVQKFTGLLLASFSWRMLFYVYMGYQFISTGFVYLSNMTQYLEFFGIYAIGSAFAAFGLLYLDKIVLKNNTLLRRVSPIVSFASLAIAIVLTLVL